MRGTSPAAADQPSACNTACVPLALCRQTCLCVHTRPLGEGGQDYAPLLLLLFRLDRVCRPRGVGERRCWRAWTSAAASWGEAARPWPQRATLRPVKACLERPGLHRCSAAHSCWKPWVARQFSLLAFMSLMLLMPHNRGFSFMLQRGQKWLIDPSTTNITMLACFIALSHLGKNVHIIHMGKNGRRFLRGDSAAVKIALRNIWIAVFKNLI